MSRYATLLRPAIIRRGFEGLPMHSASCTRWCDCNEVVLGQRWAPLNLDSFLRRILISVFERSSTRHAERPLSSLEEPMVMASELREGMALRIDQQIYRVLEVEAKAGTAKMGGTVRGRLASVRSGRQWDQHFRPLERLEDVELEKRKVEFLYSGGGNCIFQRLDSFEQVEFPAASLGLAEKLLQPGIE